MSKFEHGDVTELLRKNGIEGRSYHWGKSCNFKEMEGEILLDYAYWDEEVVIETNMATYLLRHDQSCCESVEIEDIVGDLEDFKGQVIWLAEEVTNDEDPRHPDDAKWGAFLWTFYKLGCVKGYFDLRWYGTSNGYYSEDVTVYRFPKEDKQDEVQV